VSVKPGNYLFDQRFLRPTIGLGLGLWLRLGLDLGLALGLGLDLGLALGLGLGIFTDRNRNQSVRELTETFLGFRASRS
jgi:hypothetical protein